jgi:Fur family ferric uptake transcriptional regulator
VKSNLIEQAIDATHFKRFRKDGFTLYVYGICSVCQGKMTRMRNKEEKKKLNDNKL